jgi:thiol-disulfide isomerase/thioredoxin
MKKSLFKVLCIVILALFVMSTAGAAATTSSAGKIEVVTKLSQIDTALNKKPVFIRLGASWCSHCKAFQPTFEALAKEYAGKVTFMSIDITKSPDLSKYFGVGRIPDCSVIVGKKNGKYIYMQENGKTTTDRTKARIVRDNHPKSEYEKVLNFAVKYKK